MSNYTTYRISIVQNDRFATFYVTERDLAAKLYRLSTAYSAGTVCYIERHVPDAGDHGAYVDHEDIDLGSLRASLA
jgi:hypothetical protein